MSLQNKLSRNREAAMTSVVSSLRWSYLASAVMFGLYASCFVTSGYAMESIDDQTMSDTTGADGLLVNVQASTAGANHAYWQDPTTSATTGNVLDLQNFAITNNAGSSTPFGMSATLNTGSTGGTPALQLNLNVNTPTLFTAQSIVLCGAVTSGVPGSCATNPAPSGAVQLLNGTTNGVMSTSPLTASLVTTNGFLNSAGTATVKLLLSNGNIFFTSNGTQLVTSDIYANIAATGRIWVDATDGFRFSTCASGSSGSSCTPVSGGGIMLTSPYSSDAPGSWNGTSPINAGLQYSLVAQTPTTQTGVIANQLNASASSFGTSTSNSGLTFGATGSLPYLDLTVRGASATGVTTDGVGGTVGGTANKSILGSAGGGNAIVANMTGSILTGGSVVDSTGTSLTTPSANSFKLYLGVSGTNGYGIQMSDFVPFGNVMSTTANSSFTSGNVYVNLLTSSTTQLILPISKVFAGNTPNTVSYFANGLNGETQGSLVDNTQVQDLQNVTVPATGGSLFFAIRGLSIQGVPLITSFYKNGKGVCTGSVSCDLPSTGTTGTNPAPVSGFALMPVLNNLNANITLNAATVPTTGLFAAGGALANTVAALNYSFAISIAGNNCTSGVCSSTGTEEGSGAAAGTLQESAFFLADTVNKQYVGFRDINLYLKSDGLLVLQGTATTNTFNLTMPHFMLVAQAGLAAGYLPGAEPTGAPKFTSGKDTLMTLNLGLASDAINNANNNLSVTVDSTKPSTGIFAANLTLAGTSQSQSVITACTTGTVYSCTGGATTTSANIPVQSLAGGNFFRVVDNSGSALGLDNITGTLSATAQLTVGPTTNPYNLTATPTTTNANSATVTSTLQINPANALGGELLTTLDFYPSTSGGTAMPIGKMVLTGGQIISNLTLTPVTH